MHAPLILPLLAVAALGGVLLVGAGRYTPGTRPADSAAARRSLASPDTIARGRYLVTLSGCADCHTPLKAGPQGPEPDLARAYSGHPANVKLPPPDLKPGPWFAATAGMTAWAGPWGVSYAANLTPDLHTGLGAWTEDIFIQTMRTGRHMGAGRPILPPMPWQNLAGAADEDLRAMFAFLQSLPAIPNQVPAPIPPGGQSVSYE